MYEVKWEQEGYDEPNVTLTKKFKTKKEAKSWIKEMETAANNLHRRFDVKHLKQIK